jgi:hypothetical protein
MKIGLPRKLLIEEAINRVRYKLDTKNVKGFLCADGLSKSQEISLSECQEEPPDEPEPTPGLLSKRRISLQNQISTLHFLLKQSSSY